MANTDIDKTVSDNQVVRGERFTLTQSTGSKKDGTYKLLKTYHISGLDLDKNGTPTASVKNIATLKGVLGQFPHFVTSVLGTHVGVYSRRHARHGETYTLASLLALCAPKGADNRSSKAKFIAALLKDDPESEPDDLKAKAWKRKGFDPIPTVEDFEAVRDGLDPWSDDDNE